jgi:hypothetical protein
MFSKARAIASIAPPSPTASTPTRRYRRLAVAIAADLIRRRALGSLWHTSAGATDGCVTARTTRPCLNLPRGAALAVCTSSFVTSDGEPVERRVAALVLPAALAASPLNQLERIVRDELANRLRRHLRTLRRRIALSAQHLHSRDAAIVAHLRLEQPEYQPGLFGIAQSRAHDDFARDIERVVAQLTDADRVGTLELGPIEIEILVARL